MNKESITNKIVECGAAAVIRMKESDKLLKVFDAIYSGGINIIEITMTVPNAVKVIESVAKEVNDDVVVGVGSVLNKEMTQNAIDAGAKFVVSPILKKEIIETGHQNDLPVFPGAFTPTEIQTAYEWGADIIKVFPADVVGMKYFKSIMAPLPHLKLMPTGGVTISNAGEWLRSGAVAIGIGSALLDKEAIKNEDYSLLRKNAEVLASVIKQARTK